ncbi:MAG: hypothetical protein JRE16_07195 [Deltaproteobacteria bacterium]|nr:hypothetical protein [Deltaproteobacteria bacterium]MBW2477288.1 hypothetical protein [Deltaproteobacteria bacterium]MBW2504341.1 hypothetical protein [Deltaproteobacteria bacterium]MBW2521009.1 hypothetical protein [Deltaproteobacteria bacterium]
MFKLSALISILAFIFSSWFSGFELPRFTNGPVDYLLMPLLGYVSIVVAAQIATRVVGHTAQKTQR